MIRRCLLLLAALGVCVTACSLNPQPLPPGPADYGASDASDAGANDEDSATDAPDDGIGDD